MLECSMCQLGLHLHCHEPPLPAVPRGEWVCPSCYGTPDAHRQACKQIQTALRQLTHNKTLGTRDTCTTEQLPKEATELVRHLYTTPNITWAAYLALYGEQEEEVAIVGGPSTIHNKGAKRNKNDSSQTSYLVQWGHTYINKQHIPLSVKNGYTPESTTDVTPKDITDMPYTMQMLMSSEGHNYIQMSQKVTWKPTWEPESTFSTGKRKQMLSNYKHTQTKAAQEPPTTAVPRHTTPSSTTQKAQWQGGTNPIYNALGRKVAGNLTLHTQTNNSSTKTTNPSSTQTHHTQQHHTKGTVAGRH